MRKTVLLLILALAVLAAGCGRIPWALLAGDSADEGPTVTTTPDTPGGGHPTTTTTASPDDPGTVRGPAYIDSVELLLLESYPVQVRALVEGTLPTPCHRLAWDLSGPDAFEVPNLFDGPGFRLEPLGPEHNERDHEAWMSSISHIRSTPGFPDGSWPAPMSLERNRQDLVRHARDFEMRRGLTYSILDDEDVIGCVYTYPSDRAGHDAEVSSWVRESRAEMDTVVWTALTEWIGNAWPFSHPYYAGRR